MLALSSHDCMLQGHFCPFHSLGLTGNGLCPLLFWPAHCLSSQPHRWRAAEPVVRPMARDCPGGAAILSGWNVAAQANDDELRTVRLGFVGAEACPRRIYDTFFVKKTGGMLLRATALPNVRPVFAAIGLKTLCRVLSAIPFPSVEVALASLENPQKRAATGERGMMLVRGTTFFFGVSGARGQTPP